MDHATVNHLAAAYRQGRQDALPPLVQSLARPLLAQAFRYVRDWDQAADLVQDAWLRATANIARYDASRPFAPWVRTILRNLCLKFLAGQRRQPQAVPLAAVGDPTTQRPDDQADQAVREHDLRCRVARALESLTESQRLAVTMVDLEDQPQAEVAEVLGLTRDSLRVILHRGRSAVARHLEKEDAS